MSTPAQAAASIANSKLSTGPSSDAGKQTVSSNALDHGLASSKPAHVALPGEEELFASHLESYRKAYAPANQPEEDLVRTLAESYWRLERAHKLENALFSQILQQDDYKDLDPTVAKAVAWSDKDTGLQRMALYAQRIQRTAEKTAEYPQSHPTGAQSRLQPGQGRGHVPHPTLARQRQQLRTRAPLRRPASPRRLCLFTR